MMICTTPQCAALELGEQNSWELIDLYALPVSNARLKGDFFRLNYLSPLILPQSSNPQIR